MCSLSRQATKADILPEPKPDLKIALDYCRQAIEHYPMMGQLAECLKLRSAIVALYRRESKLDRR